MTTEVSAAAWPSTTGHPGTSGNPLESLRPTKLKNVSRATPVMMPGRISGQQHEPPEGGLAREVEPVEHERARHAHQQRDDHRQQRELQARQGRGQHRPVVRQRDVPRERAELERPGDDRRVVERVDDHHHAAADR